jgi:hypothetical protein
MSATAQQTEYACEVKEVFSGDDLVVMVDLGVENLFRKQRVRLSGVDTPNAVGAGETTAAGIIRREIRMLAIRKKAKLTIVSRNTNSWVVVLIVETPEGPVNVNERLIAQGYEYKAKR